VWQLNKAWSYWDEVFWLLLLVLDPTLEEWKIIASRIPKYPQPDAYYLEPQ
jgi:hypothetical protein